MTWDDVVEAVGEAIWYADSSRDPLDCKDLARVAIRKFTQLRLAAVMPDDS